MANSLLLRGEAGRMDGYVERRADALRCRVTRGVAQGARLLVRFAGGQMREYPLREGSEEQRFPAPEGAFCGACVVTGNGVLCATDEAARKMGWAALNAADRAEKAQEQPPYGPPDAEKEQKAQTSKACRADIRLPEMRWPPPPCLRALRYDGGRWVSREEETQDGAAPARGAP